jgi:carbon catabolite-derepressing protein kinase
MESFIVAEFAEAERDAQLAAMDVRLCLSFMSLTPKRTTSQPRNTVSPSVISPVVADLEENPFETEFNAEYADEEEAEDDELDFISPPETGTNFAVLHSSLPEQLPEQHHLTSYASAKRSGAKEKKQHKTKWHFGIRSRSPPMEVMLEIYRTLKTLGMEWKEKKNLGGLGGLKARSGRGMSVERVRELDGGGGVDLKAASSIYFVETRARVQDVVVCIPSFFLASHSFFSLY